MRGHGIPGFGGERSLMHVAWSIGYQILRYGHIVDWVEGAKCHIEGA